jgi:uncharacterized protein (DUF2236 family)
VPEESGLINVESFARAFDRAVLERPVDDGLFGPGSLVWRVHRDRSFLLAGVRSLMMQALHPLPMAGVAQHSTWQSDPFGRLAATGGYVLAVTYGDTKAADRAAARVRAIHTHVNGADTVTGLPYSASDPGLLLWIHAALVESIVAVITGYGSALKPDEADRYVAEMVPFAEIVGVPRDMVPSSMQALTGYMESIDLLQATPAAKEAIGIVLDPPRLDPATLDLWHDLGRVAIGTLPQWAREMYGFEAPPRELLERESVRQLIGAIDFAFEALPGVLEARERIELRMRAHA